MTICLIGRFAPSPTGPLHFGSVVTAVGSFLDARSQGGRWLVRIDDIDPPREAPGASDTILNTLEALGLKWDDKVLFQSTRISAYRAAIERLSRTGQIYSCACSRRNIKDGPYPGTCRDADVKSDTKYSVRVRVDNQTLTIRDAVQGDFTGCLGETSGDFIIRRRNGLYAYHLAAVVDDAWQQVNSVIRGVDLLDSTPQQLYLQMLLGFEHPHYAHLPVALGDNGTKLSKQTRAAPVLPTDASSALFHALRFLGLKIPDAARHETPEDQLTWALPRWDLARVDPNPRKAHWPYSD